MDRTLSCPYVATRARRNWLQLLQLLQRWQRNYRSRQQLAQLDDRQLADVGTSNRARSAELEKPFWR